MEKLYLILSDPFKAHQIRCKSILFAIALFLINAASTAQTSSTASATLASSDTNLPGTVLWTNPANVYADDTAYSYATLTSGGVSRNLRATNFNFSIPAGAVITGVTATVLRGSNSVSAGKGIYDSNVQLIKNGIYAGSDLSSATLWNTGIAPTVYGGAANMWGTTLTAADVNDPDFGFAISVTADANRTAYIDNIQLTVHYIPAPSISSFTGSGVCFGGSASVIITGQHFLNVNNVSFNGVSASYTVNSNTQITAQLPAGATTGNITVTSDSGTGTSAATFVVNPLPVVSAISGPSTFCVGVPDNLSNATPGGVWNSANGSIATINSSGLVTPLSAGTTSITYTVTDSNGCVSSVAFPITVNAPVTVSPSANVCIGNTTQLSPTTGGSWSSSNTAVAEITPSGLISGISEGSATMTFTSAAGCISTTAVTVYAQAAITLDPVDVLTCSSGSAQFTVAASGTGLTYQWFKGASPLSNGGNLSGTQTATLSVNPVSISDAGSYHCKVGSICGNLVSSANAVLSVTQQISITAQPVSVSICESGNAVFTVAVAGDVASYQWYKDGTALSDTGNVSGSATNTLTISGVTPSDASNSYYCEITAVQPCADISTVNASLVISQTAQVDSQPSDVTVCSGSAASFSISASGASLSYKWYKGAVMLADGGSISGSSTPTLSINPTAVADQGTYYCKVSGQCNDADSNSAELVVNQAVSITSNPVASQTLCSGVDATLTVSATGDGLTYQWFKGAIALTDGGNISGANTATLTLSPLAMTDASALYRCEVSGIAPCGSQTSANASISVIESPSISVEPIASQIKCSGSSVSMSATAGGGGLTYQWFKDAAMIADGGNISGATTASLTINPSTVADSGDYHLVVTNLCNSATTAVSMLTVNQKPIIPAQTAITCTGVSFNVLPVDGIPDAATVIPAGTTYSWPAPSVTGSMTGGSAQSGQTSIFGTLNNATNIVRTATYTVTPTSADGCPGTPFTVVVSVKPKPAINTFTRTVCNGQSFTVLPTNSGGNIVPAGTTYTWDAPSVTGGITGGTAGSGAISIVQTLVNPTTSPEVATYTVTPTVNGCDGTPFTINVTVNPAPTASVNLPTQTICSATAVSPIIVSNNNGTLCNVTYNWVRDNTANVTGVASGTGTVGPTASYTITPTFTNTTNVAQTVTLTITPSSNGYQGAPVTATVIVQAASVGGAATISAVGVTPVVSVTTVCHYATGEVYLSGNTGNVIRWESSTTGGTIWVPISNTTSTLTYTNITVTTLFRAVIQNAGCALAYSTAAIVNVVPNVKPTPVTASPSVICQGQSSILSSQSGYATSAELQQGGTFQTSNPQGWLADGCGNCLNAGASNTFPGPFQLSATNGGTYSGTNYTATGKFAIANGNFNSFLETPTFNTLGLTTASLRFNHAFNLLAGASVKVELSLDGGASYGITLAQWNGPATRTPYNNFPLSNLSLNNYIGQTNLKVRFSYVGTVGSSWAIDNILIPEQPSNLTTQWIEVGTGTVISTAASLTVTPAVTTTYAITTTLNGCTSFGPDGTTYVTVTVNNRPTALIGTDQTICYDGTATFSIQMTGVAPWSVTYSNGTTSTTVNDIMTSPYVFSVPNITANQTYTVTALSDTRCSALAADLTGSAIVTVLNGTQGLWTGLVSNDWFDCMNWAGGLPSLTVNAVIPATAPRMPVIDHTTSPFAAAYGNIALAQDIEIANGASLTMMADTHLHVSRNWLNGGTFTCGTGTVTFNGATSSQIQTINNGIKNNEQFYNLTLNATNGASGILLPDGFELTVANHVTLTSGDLRLAGEAQLVQNGTTANPTTGTGLLLRDQQGTRSSYNYNYWSSPVSANGTSYTVGSVLRDGTNSAANPFALTPITFGNGVYFADGALASPIKISNSWINKYTAVSNSYYGWQFIGSTGSVNVGEGFTMKGCDGFATPTDPQNYTFVGKPNNGTITRTIAIGQSYLLGNPYPSALDADLFIRDNIKDGGNATTNMFTGALYFWDHFGGQTHLVAGYVGGYATYSLMGGVVAIANSPLNINDGSTGVKVPTRYVAVGQGFFVGTILDPLLTTNNPNLTSPITGGPMVFQNSQRAFRTEASASSVFFRPASITATPQLDGRSKITLRFESPSGMNRQLLVGADDLATDAFDLGYDAPSVDVNNDDMYWEYQTAKLVIQALPDFNPARIIPLGVKLNSAGDAQFSIPQTESFDSAIYLHDALTGIFYDISENPATISLPAGEHANRFSLRFSATSLSTNDPNAAGEMFIGYKRQSSVINISNIVDRISSVEMYDISGKMINSWNPDNHGSDLELAVDQVAAGTYIVKVISDNATTTKKIAIK